jgi:hypothetical protein
MMRLAGTLVMLGSLVLVGCGNKEDAAAPAAEAKVVDQGKAAPAKAPAAAPAAAPASACAAGFTDPGNIGACVKLPAGLKPDPTTKPPGGSKGAAFVGDGHTTLTITTEPKSDMFWDDHVKSLLAGGGFGGKLLEQGKFADGVWAVFDVDGGERKYSGSLSRGKTTTVDCLATHDVHGQDKPTMEEMMETCKTIVAQ